MSGLFEIVDSAPGLYLFAVAFLIYQVARSMRRQLTFIGVWQDVFGLGTFMFLLVRRLVWSSPTNAIEVMDVLFRAIAFGLVAFGLAGVAGISSMITWRSTQRTYLVSRAQFDRWRRTREQKRRDAENAIPAPAPTARELEQARIERQRHEAKIQKREDDRQRKLELKLEVELEMEFAADQKRRKTLDEFIKTYADESLPVEVYEQRLAMIRDAAVRNAPARAKQYRSMQEIIDDFDRQLVDVDQSTQSEFEKESLRSMILMERQNAIQRFIQS